MIIFSHQIFQMIILDLTLDNEDLTAIQLSENDDILLGSDNESGKSIYFH